MYKKYFTHYNPNKVPDNFISIIDSDFEEILNPISSNGKTFSHVDVAITIAGVYYIKNLNVAANIILHFIDKCNRGFTLTPFEQAKIFIDKQPFNLCSKDELEKYLLLI